MQMILDLATDMRRPHHVLVNARGMGRLELGRGWPGLAWLAVAAIRTRRRRVQPVLRLRRSTGTSNGYWISPYVSYNCRDSDNQIVA
jgi:hypothetical protein